MARPLEIDWQHSEEALRQRYLNEVDHQDRMRLHAIWLVRRGYPMTDVAEWVGVCYKSVRRWVNWYRAGGIEEVLAHRHGGRTGRASHRSIEGPAGSESG